MAWNRSYLCLGILAANVLERPKSSLTDYPYGSVVIPPLQKLNPV